MGGNRAQPPRNARRRFGLSPVRGVASFLHQRRCRRGGTVGPGFSSVGLAGQAFAAPGNPGEPREVVPFGPVEVVADNGTGLTTHARCACAPRSRDSPARCSRPTRALPVRPSPYTAATTTARPGCSRAVSSARARPPGSTCTRTVRAPARLRRPAERDTALLVQLLAVRLHEAVPVREHEHPAVRQHGCRPHLGVPEHGGPGPTADTTNGATPVWEPFLLLHENKLICYYSDQRDPDFGQKLAHQASTDLRTWGPVVNDATARPTPSGRASPWPS